MRDSMTTYFWKWIIHLWLSQSQQTCHPSRKYRVQGENVLEQQSISDTIISLILCVGLWNPVAYYWSQYLLRTVYFSYYVQTGSALSIMYFWSFSYSSLIVYLVEPQTVSVNQTTGSISSHRTYLTMYMHVPRNVHACHTWGCLTGKISL